MTFRLPAFAVAIVSLVLAPAAGRAEDWVTVHAWAHPEYLARRAAHPEKRETYVVAKGEYFAGSTRDPTIEKTSFEGLVQHLAADMAKQNYYPTKQVQDADLLIVVHWGTTSPYVSDYDLQQQSNPNYYDPHNYSFASPNAMADPSRLTADPTQVEVEQGQLGQEYNNQNLARAADAQAFDSAAHTLTSTSIQGILGYTSALAKMSRATTTTEEEKTLLVNESEERYFIIVCAFDMHDLLENHHKKLLWTSHMSMRAPGTNFTEAVPRMSEVASLTYGQSLDGIVQQRSLPEAVAGHVKIGPIRILGMTAAPTAGK
ncbi:MAG TPA: hypothetical protein VHV47_06535 [Opitutaceae bacterium]|jgi:hypothetical protein|nr:hypothetical protein [Opitutaceae bacterium]